MQLSRIYCLFTYIRLDLAFFCFIYEGFSFLRNHLYQSVLLSSIRNSFRYSIKHCVQCTFTQKINNDALLSVAFLETRRREETFIVSKRRKFTTICLGQNLKPLPQSLKVLNLGKSKADQRSVPSHVTKVSEQIFIAIQSNASLKVNIITQNTQYKYFQFICGIFLIQERHAVRSVVADLAEFP